MLQTSSLSLLVFNGTNDSFPFQIRRAFRNIRRTLVEIIFVLILFFFSIMIFALMALKLFDGRYVFAKFFENQTLAIIVHAKPAAYHVLYRKARVCVICSC